jgi:hypothetical protein
LLSDDAAERLKHPLAVFDGQDAPELVQRETGRWLGSARGGTGLVLGCRMMALLAELRADARRTTGRDSRAPTARLWAAQEGTDEMLLHGGCACLSWHHHMTLSLLALWFLILERRRVGGENPGGDRVAGAGDLRAAAADPGPECGADRGGGDAGAVAEGGGADLQMAQGHRDVPSPPPCPGYELNSCAAA